MRGLVSIASFLALWPRVGTSLLVSNLFCFIVCSEHLTDLNVYRQRHWWYVTTLLFLFLIRGTALNGMTFDRCLHLRQQVQRRELPSEFIPSCVASNIS